MKLKLFIILITSAAMVPALPLRAQIVPDPVSLIASPASPSPGNQVTVRAATPTFDKNTAVFQWTVNGRAQPILSGLGKDTFSLVAGDVGTAIRVEVAVVRADGSGGGSAALIIRPADLALTWFAETYVPRWYKGKALPTQNSVVNVVAIPRMSVSGAVLRTENLIFNWSIDDEDDIESGVGQNVFRIRVSDLPNASHHVKVTVRDPENRVKKDGEIFITSGRPRAVIYPVSPLGGIDPRSAPSIFSTAARGLLDFAVEPFFFPGRERQDLSYQWNIAGGEARGVAEKPYFLSLDTGNQPISIVPLSVSVKSGLDFLSPATRLLTLLLQ